MSYDNLPAFEIIGSNAVRCENVGARRGDSKIRSVIMNDRDAAIAVLYVSPDASLAEFWHIAAVNRAVAEKPS